MWSFSVSRSFCKGLFTSITHPFSILLIILNIVGTGGGAFRLVHVYTNVLSRSNDCVMQHSSHIKPRMYLVFIREKRGGACCYFHGLRHVLECCIVLLCIVYYSVGRGTSSRLICHCSQKYSVVLSKLRDSGSNYTRSIAFIQT